jgi:hypothetical protein
MDCTWVGVQMVGTITVGASGGADNTGTIIPARSNVPFKNLNISVVPLSKTASYYVYVFHDGELEEQHNFVSASKVICHMAFPDFIFPANHGTHAIPKYYADSEKDYYGVPIRLQIVNYASFPATFYIYSVYEEFEHCRFASISQES